MHASPTRDSWQRRIDRASELAAQDETARALLDVYHRLLVLQRHCDAWLQAHLKRLTGSLERDLPVVRPCAQQILQEVSDFAPPSLLEQGRLVLEDGESAIDSTLLEDWRAPSARSFFAKVLLQPYAQCLAASGIRPIDRNLPHRNGTCPFCAGPPVVSVLHHAADGDAGGRDLVCGMCFTSWPYRRVLCAHCGEDDEAQLGYFHSPPYDHVRIDACERCKHYLKSIDLTRLGFAVPVVDEVAAAPLDLWAVEHGYQKIELNLVGL